ncbi:hypothetical protein B9Z55_008474 [Caenorhabditis nigoni]|uniref:Tyrosine-protein phosphatase domain-containing protein n=2 Tax=Caenorhabditis nigoni TaxID=1611254 RepID=A0A2G5UMT6_9PELO|nr:hypothetical protein B9Z55_008474 [Caenorhabditis nigoni]
MDGQEWAKSGEPRKVSTIEKYFAMIDQCGIGAVAQLNPFENEKGERLCARFYGDRLGQKMVFGRYTVETIEVSRDFEGFASSIGFSRFTLQITNSQNGNAKREFFVLRYAYWNDLGTPREPESHWTSSSFVIIRKETSSCKVFMASAPLEHLVLPIRNKLPGAVSTVKQLAYLVLSISKGVMKEEKVENDPNYEKMYFIHLEMRHEKEYPEPHLLWHNETRKVKKTAQYCEDLRKKMVKYSERKELQRRRKLGENLDEDELEELEKFEEYQREDESIEEEDQRERLIGDEENGEEKKKEDVPKGEKASKNSKSKGSKSSKNSKATRKASKDSKPSKPSGGSKVSKASNPSKDSKPSGPSKSKKTKREPQKLEKAGKTQDMED